jgi:hypothetical protein
VGAALYAGRLLQRGFLDDDVAVLVLTNLIAIGDEIQSGHALGADDQFLGVSREGVGHPRVAVLAECVD